MKLLLCLVLTFHASDWHSTQYSDRSGTWQAVSGPAERLKPKLEYDSQVKYLQLKQEACN